LLLLCPRLQSALVLLFVGPDLERGLVLVLVRRALRGVRGAAPRL
jgi:hypothetical protein